MRFITHSIQSSKSSYLFSFLLLMIHWGCQDIAITNPFDPQAPQSIQARGSLTGSIETSLSFYDLTQVSVSLLSIDTNQSYTISVAADGAFSQNDLLTGLYVLSISASAHLNHQQPVEIRYNDLELDPIELLPLQNTDQAVLVQGRVQLEGNQSSAGVQVRAFIGDQQQTLDFTDAQGNFSLQLSPLEHRLVFYQPGYQTLEQEIYYQTEGDLAGQFTVNEMVISDQSPFTLYQSKGQITVQVNLAPTWLPEDQKSFQIHLVSESHSHSEESDADMVTITDLPVGVYTLSVEREGFESYLEQITINEESNQNYTATISLTHLALTDLNLKGLTLTSDQLREIPHLKGGNLEGIRLVGGNENEGGSLCGLNLNGVSFIDAQLLNVDLRGASLINAQFNQAILNGAQLNGANLTNASFFETQLNQARFMPSDGVTEPCNGLQPNQQITRLNNANFSYATLQGAYFDITNPSGDALVLDDEQSAQCMSGDLGNPTMGDRLAINLAGVNWSHADLSGAHMTQLNLSDSIWTAVNMEEVDLRQSCLANNIISYSDLRQTRLEQTDLSRTSINNTLLTQANFTNAQVTGLQILDSYLEQANLANIYVHAEGESIGGVTEEKRLIMRNVVVDGASLRQAQIPGSRLTNIFWAYNDLSQVELDDSIINNSQFLNCDLNQSSFSGATLSYVDFLGVSQAERIGEGMMRETHNNLANTDFTYTQLNYTNFFNIILNNANFDHSTQNRVQFTQSNLSDTRFTNAELNDVNLSKTRIEGSDFSNTTITEVNFFLAVYNTQTVWPMGWNPTLIDAFGPYSQLQNIDFPTGVDASFADLTGIVMGFPPTSNDLIEMNFQSSNLAFSQMESLDLIGANLRDAILNDSNFKDSSLSTTDLFGAQLDRAFLQNVLIEGSNLLGTSMEDIDLFVATIRHSQLRGVDLSTANLDYASIHDLIGGCPQALPNGWMCKIQPNATGEMGGPDNRHVLISAQARLEDVNLSDMDLSGLTLYNRFNDIQTGFEDRFINLQGSDLQNTNLSDTDLRYARLERTNLGNADLSNADLRHAATKDIVSCPATLPTDWTCVEQSEDQGGYALVGEHANLSAVQFSRSDLRNTTIRNADFSNADLSFSNLRGLDFQGVVLESSDLRGADLRNSTSLNNQNFSSTDLRDVKLSGTDLSYSIFSGANLDFANLSGSELVEVTWSGRSRGVVLSNSNLQRAQMSNAYLREANLRSADLRGANLSGANLIGADLAGAQVDDQTQFFGSVMSDTTRCPGFETQDILPNCGFF